jgi:hypothetical protein
MKTTGGKKPGPNHVMRRVGCLTLSFFAEKEI